MISQRQCQTEGRAYASKMLVVEEVMAMFGHLHVQTLGQSSPFLRKGPQKRLNPNATSRSDSCGDRLV